ncbi:hypothetical protein [Methanosphaerula subterraneus]|uniref:hypothetical protein n=1 Tax=Methanosphaerula subterraneus TaxID=3350244 RepID=UPI003F859713
MLSAGAWRIFPILSDFFESYESYPASMVIGQLQTMKETYEKECISHQTTLHDQAVITVHTRRVPYQVQWDLLKKCMDDLDDIEVILDAHDLAILEGDITFFSGDMDHIVSNRDSILRHTQIEKIVYLGDV